MEHALLRHIPLSAWIAIALFGSVCSLALWKGDREERIVAIVMILGALFTPILKDDHWLGPQWNLFLVDLAACVLFLLIAMRSRRWWPLFAAAFQFLMVITHAASMVDRTLGAWAYITAGVIWSYALLGSVLVGTLNTWREKSRTRAS